MKEFNPDYQVILSKDDYNQLTAELDAYRQEIDDFLKGKIHYVNLAYDSPLYDFTRERVGLYYILSSEYSHFKRFIKYLESGEIKSHLDFEQLESKYRTKLYAAEKDLEDLRKEKEKLSQTIDDLSKSYRKKQRELDNFKKGSWLKRLFNL